ncbi:MAG: hypothetical protein ABL959_12675 [Pyrinomonadaceae bacterium]
MRILFIGFSLLFCLSCSSVVKMQSDDFEVHYDKGKAFLANGQFDEAEQSLLLAEEKAKKTKWNDGVIMCKRELALVEIGKKDFLQAEKLLGEGIEICRREATCESEDIALLHGYLNHLYLYQTKQVEKAIENVGVLGKDITDKNGDKAVVCKSIEGISKAGFSEEATPLAKREGCPT